MKHATSIFICLLMLAGIACKKKQVETANQLYFKETQCANPWTRMTGLVVQEPDTVQIKNWLLQNGITPYKITITERKGVVVCDACHCPSGRNILVVFIPADIEKAKSLGFLKL